MTLRGLQERIQRAMELMEERFRNPDGTLRAVESEGKWTLAQAKGHAAHKAMEAFIKEHYPTWVTEERYVGLDGKGHQPDFVTPDYIVELKPLTKSGIKNGRRQKRRYEMQLLGKIEKKKVIVIYYEPELRPPKRPKSS